MTDFESQMLQHQIDVKTELATLSTQMQSLVGNGQPGRIGKLETKLEDLETFKNRAIGIGSAVAFLSTLGQAALHYFWRR